MFSPDLLGILFGLTSALVWGSGDFSGGFATRKINQFQVLVLASFSGILILLVLAFIWNESLPSLADAGWAALAGISGALGILALYRALSLGYAATVAPTAAVLSAALPVVFNFFTNRPPNGFQLAGFVLALAGIGLVSKSSASDKLSRTALGLAFLAGLGFGGFFILIAQVGPGAVFAPLLVARFVSLGTALALLLVNRLPMPSPLASPVALLAGILDTGGNVFYVLAQQFTRLDVAAVLASFYPATTVLLAYLILREKVAPLQWLGAALCLASVALIAL
jgi:drug/metabolite transporter (DMT)-like permease